MRFCKYFYGHCRWAVLHSYPKETSYRFKAAPFSYSLLSFFIPLMPTIFPWNMGYTWLWMQLPAFQTAELWGFRFLNTLFYIFNLLFWLVFKHKWDGIGKTALASAIALFAILNGLGDLFKKKTSFLRRKAITSSSCSTQYRTASESKTQKKFQKYTRTGVFSY